MYRQWIVVATVLALVGCASGVKLDNVAVEDRTGVQVGANSGSGPVGPSGTGPGTGGVGQTGVAPVDLRPIPASDTQSTGKVIYFDYDSVSIKPEYQALIEAHARTVRTDKTKRLQIEGHTDERGGREYNLALGQRRAEVVRKAMELLGVAETQIEAVSFGKEKPAVEGGDEAALAKNRRAEITYR